MIMNDHRKIIKVLFSRMANTRRITSLKMLPECTKLYKNFLPKYLKVIPQTPIVGLYFEGKREEQTGGRTCLRTYAPMLLPSTTEDDKYHVAWVHSDGDGRDEQVAMVTVESRPHRRVLSLVSDFDYINISTAKHLRVV